MKTAKLFLDGPSQAVRLQEELRFSGNEVFVKRLGKAVLLIPIEDCWDTLIQSLDAISPDFMSERDQPAQPNREPIEP
jgi:antitoxin VapB